MIIVLGDAIIDEYVEFETVRQCPEGEWPIVREVNRYENDGGASAVTSMVEALGEHACYIYGGMRPVKRRELRDGDMVHRIDDNLRSEPLRVNDSWGFPRGQIVLLADYGRGSIDRHTIEACLDRGWKVIVDPHPTQDPAIYRGCWAICPNRAENEQHGYWDNFPRVCLKLDYDGISVRDDPNLEKHFHSVADHPIVDVCGAGDQVIATIGVALSEGMSFLEACRLANIAAGIKCGKHGATPVTRSEFNDQCRTVSVPTQMEATT